MKTQLIIYPALVGMLFVACGEKEKNSYTEAMQEEVAMEPAAPIEPLGQHELVDTLLLPDPLKIILEKDEATSLENIKSLRKYNEEGTDYYEIVFVQPINGKDTITYDNLGKIKSPDLN